MKFRLTISKRLMASFAIMTALVIIASGIGIFSINMVWQTTNAAQTGINQVERVADLSFVWSEVAATIDNMLLTRQISLIEGELEQELTTFNQQVAAMQSQPMGQSPDLARENQQIIEELNLLGVELNRIVDELTTLAQEQRWARAQALRHTELVSFQRRFDERLVQLNNNTREEVDQLVTRAISIQQTARRLWLATILAAIVFASGFGVVAIRSITRPVKLLTGQTRRIAQRDFSPITPLPQRDEIGELSQTIALMTDWLRESYQTLEQRVVERTRRLEMVATVSERINILRSVDEVLAEVINQIEQNFDFYHAHIYLLDQEQERLLVSAGMGEAGAMMKTRGHNIPLEAVSLVARAARTGQAVWADNVTTTPDWLPNALLPKTQSELAVPISVDNQVVGVLDVQSDQPAGFDDSDVNVLRYLASQIAVAIQNARLFEQVETALAKAEAAYARYVEQSWEKNRIVQRHGQSFYVQSTLADPEAAQMLAEARREASGHTGPTLVTVNGENEEKSVLVAPVTLRNNRIGAAQLFGPKVWHADDLAVVEAVLDQLAQSADSIRLFEETRERASREQLIGQISDKLRRAPDIETLVKVGVDELARILGPAHVYATVGSEAELRRNLETGVTEQDSAGWSPDLLSPGDQPASNGRGGS